MAAGRAGVHTGDDDALDLVGGEVGRLQRRVPGLLDERAVLDLAEALFPRPRTRRARSAPPLEELLGRARAAEVFGDDGAVGVVTDEQRARAVAGGRFVATGGESAALVGGDEQHRAATGERGPHGADRRPERAAEVERGHVGVEPQCRVQGRRVVLVEIRGRRGGEPERVRRGATGGAAQREPRRLDTHGGGVLVVGRDRTGSLAAAAPEGLGDLGPLKAPEGHVAADADDASHGPESMTPMSAPRKPCRLSDVASGGALPEPTGFGDLLRVHRDLYGSEAEIRGRTEAYPKFG